MRPLKTSWDMPLAATGKIDKVRLRRDYATAAGDPN